MFRWASHTPKHLRESNKFCKRIFVSAKVFKWQQMFRHVRENRVIVIGLQLKGQVLTPPDLVTVVMLPALHIY